MFRTWRFQSVLYADVWDGVQEHTVRRLKESIASCKRNEETGFFGIFREPPDDP